MMMMMMNRCRLFLGVFTTGSFPVNDGINQSINHFLTTCHEIVVLARVLSSILLLTCHCISLILSFVYRLISPLNPLIELNPIA